MRKITTTLAPAFALALLAGAGTAHAQTGDAAGAEPATAGSSEADIGAPTAGTSTGTADGTADVQGPADSTSGTAGSELEAEADDSADTSAAGADASLGTEAEAGTSR